VFEAEKEKMEILIGKIEDLKRTFGDRLTT